MGGVPNDTRPRDSCKLVWKFMSIASRRRAEEKDRCTDQHPLSSGEFSLQVRDSIYHPSARPARGAGHCRSAGNVVPGVWRRAGMDHRGDPHLLVEISYPTHHFPHSVPSGSRPMLATTIFPLPDLHCSHSLTRIILFHF